MAVNTKDASNNTVSFKTRTDGSDLVATNDIGQVETSAASLGKAEDAVHNSGDAGVFLLCVRKDTAAQLAGTDGDYSGLINDANGRLHVLDQNSAAALTALQIMDDWDETNRAAVNLIASQVGVAGGTGTDAANVLRVSLATDIALPTGTNTIGKVQPHDAILQVTEVQLVGINDTAVAASQYSSTGDIALGGTYSGEILGFTLVSTEDGTGAVQTPNCTILFFDTDPNTTSGDTTLAAAEFLDIIGKVDVASGEWHSDANGAVVFKNDPIPFHAVSTIYAVLFLKSGETTINSAAGDDEQIEINIRFRRDS